MAGELQRCDPPQGCPQPVGIGVTRPARPGPCPPGSAGAARGPRRWPASGGPPCRTRCSGSAGRPCAARRAGAAAGSGVVRLRSIPIPTFHTTKATTRAPSSQITVDRATTRGYRRPRIPFWSVMHLPGAISRPERFGGQPALQPRPGRADRRRQPEALDDRGVGHAAALAHGLQAVAAAGALELVEQRGHEPGARAAERVAEGDGAAVDVDLAPCPGGAPSPRPARPRRRPR